MATIGSDAWLGAGSNDAEQTRVTEFVARINWPALLHKASQGNNGVSCKLSEKYSHGINNLVRKLEFADGTQWVARLPLPELPDAHEVVNPEHRLQVDIATMKYIRKHTSIPVPEVFAYDLSPDNEVGAPYILMSYIHGTSAMELSQARGYDLQKDEKFWQGVADIQMQLASLHFDKIGCIYQDSSSDSFTIGPDVVTGLGPWDDAETFWSDLAQHYLQNVMAAGTAAAGQDDDDDEEGDEAEPFQLPPQFANFPALIQMLSKERPFRLTNRDFGIHNLLVNDAFEIVGLIDLDGVMAAPVEMVAQMPRFSGLDLPLPGFGDEGEAEDAEEGNEEAIGMYIARLQDAVSRIGGAELGELVESFTSTEAGIVQGLYRFHQAATGSALYQPE
ncbi:hypothetical protein CLAFUW4_09198 [Fulvia fulva]|nr:hypothetical protein CLAFUR4_09204 [Fulvia fulva]KAK4614971.1 hypothetical protein CLAFUR0_09196 [Fulvia fulva]WPV20699.1 hypothetical protein CLAFUW4_09198 [Fulvia fulva]WPV35338.1 hypothetical protein CLAFUW7_09199 [Fulvia fulva]